jgi:uncharacterized protein
MSPASPLPRNLDLRKAASKSRYYAGELALDALPQVAAAILPQAAVLHVEANCLRDEQRRAVVDLQVSGSLELLCQRCLELMLFAVQCSQRLAVVADDEAARQLPRSLEPLVVHGDAESDLWSIVEEEVLLALPSVALHSEECLPALRDFASTDADVPPAEVKQNPFTVLAALKNAATKPSQE